MTHDILDIEDMVLKEGEENMITIKYKPETQKNENFRTNECLNIIKIFKELKEKAYKQLDEKKAEKQSENRTKVLQKKLNKELFG